VRFSYSKPTLLAILLVAVSLLAVACAEQQGIGECLEPRDGELVAVPCEVPEGETPLATQPGGTPPGNGGNGGGPGLATMLTAGCGACHTVDGTSLSGAVGPNLTNVAAKGGAEYIRESIVNPNAVIAEGFSADVMPPNFGDTLSEEDLNAIVEYLNTL
jgi:mono/diheme cytochrome c family protein